MLRGYRGPYWIDWKVAMRHRARLCYALHECKSGFPKPQVEGSNLPKVTIESRPGTGRDYGEAPD